LVRGGRSETLPEAASGFQRDGCGIQSKNERNKRQTSEKDRRSKSKEKTKGKKAIVCYETGDVQLDTKTSVRET